MNRGHNRNRGGSYNSGFTNNHNDYNNINNNNNSRNFTGNSGFQNRISEYNNQNKIWVEIEGWTNATKDNLVSFISRKTNIGLKNVEVHGDILRGSVNNKKDADYLKKFSGTRFASNTLKITVLNSNEVKNTADLLRRFLSRRFMVDQRLLDLTSMGSDAELLESGIFSNPAMASKMFIALMQLSTEEPYKSGVDSLNLSENANLFDNTETVASICSTFPSLKNLSLSACNIQNFKVIESFKNKLINLTEAIFAGNPISNDPRYSIEVMKSFPRLLILDGHPVRDGNKLKEICKFPLLRKQFFFEDGQIQSLSGEFISSFINFWDNDRTQLMPLYTPDSQFSISVDSGAPSINSETATGFQDRSHANWEYYLPISRNLTKIASPNIAESKLGKGQQKILDLFQSIPKSKHLLSTNPERFSTDSWKINDNCISIILHGDYEETAAPEKIKTLSKGPRRGYHGNNNANTKYSLSKRSFDRSWLIVSAGSSFVIASDLLVIRAFGGIEQWTPSSQQQLPIPPVPQLPSSSTITPTAGLIPPEIASKLTPQQQEILIQIITQTKLNINYSGMLAEQSNWDINLAMQNFEVSKNTIPPDAFM